VRHRPPDRDIVDRTGLPPSADAADAFAADPSEAAYRATVQQNREALRQRHGSAASQAPRRSQKKAITGISGMLKVGRIHWSS